MIKNIFFALIITAFAANCFAGWEEEIEKEAKAYKNEQKKIQRIMRDEKKEQEYARINEMKTNNEGYRYTISFTKGMVSEGDWAIHESGCLKAYEGESSFQQRTNIHVCQKLVERIGVSGLDCATCSGTFRVRDKTYIAEVGGRIIRASGFHEGLEFDITEKVFIIRNGRYSVTFGIQGEGSFVESTKIQSIFGQVRISFPKDSSINIIAVELPMDATQKLLALTKGTAYSIGIKTQYQIVDDIFQYVSMNKGVGGREFAGLILLNPTMFQEIVKEFLMKNKKETDPQPAINPFSNKKEKSM